ncbi:NlpC/P60 family protein [Paraburkholderia azotifigens]|uniref:NlpC/P60 family protein n=1 Tax=Paraburkholderia azotifigens TaxID=2057004 RepID=UPI003180E716
MAHHPHHKHLHQRKSTEPPFNVDTDDPVIRACEHQWDAHKSDCSGFVRAVATELGISLSGNANQLVALMNSSSQWRDLGTDASQAMSYANNGYLVVAGLATSGHGHVAVVVRANSSVPIAYWGKLHSVGRKHASIHYSWNAHDLKHVSYFARTV